MLGSGDSSMNYFQFKKPHVEAKEKQGKSVFLNILMSIIKFMSRIVEVLLPIGNMVFTYPSYAIKVRAWMDYLLGTQVVDTILGSNGVFKLVLLLEEAST